LHTLVAIIKVLEEVNKLLDCMDLGPVAVDHVDWAVAVLGTGSERLL
jgi:hypothetical protein